MTILETSQLTPGQKEIMFTLWNKEYPAKLSFSDIAGLDNYLAALINPQFFLLQNDTEKIEGWAIKFIRTDEVWFALVIDSSVHGKGKGTVLLNKLKENESNLTGWVIDHEDDIKQNGEKYKSPMAFYLKNDFTIHPGRRFETEMMSAVKISWQRK